VALNMDGEGHGRMWVHSAPEDACYFTVRYVRYCGETTAWWCSDKGERGWYHTMLSVPY
jgi:hypothetical protein